MFPIGDDNPPRRQPVLTVGLSAVCILVFLYQLPLAQRATAVFIYSWGAIPAEILGGRSIGPPSDVPAWLTVLTSMFLHGDFMHIIGNMLFLWIFGNNVEDQFGHVRFIVFYVLCGIAAAAVHGFSEIGSPVPMIGASGAISGVLGAYILMFPHARVRVLIWFGIITVVQLRAWIVLGLWFALQLVNAVLVPVGTEGGVAFWAHVGGFAGGAMLLPLFRPARRHAPGPWG